MWGRRSPLGADPPGLMEPRPCEGDEGMDRVDAQNHGRRVLSGIHSAARAIGRLGLAAGESRLAGNPTGETAQARANWSTTTSLPALDCFSRPESTGIALHLHRAWPHTADILPDRTEVSCLFIDETTCILSFLACKATQGSVSFCLSLVGRTGLALRSFVPPTSCPAVGQVESERAQKVPPQPRHRRRTN